MVSQWVPVKDLLAFKNRKKPQGNKSGECRGAAQVQRIYYLLKIVLQIKHCGLAHYPGGESGCCSSPDLAFSSLIISSVSTGLQFLQNLGEVTLLDCLSLRYRYHENHRYVVPVSTLGIFPFPVDVLIMFLVFSSVHLVASGGYNLGVLPFVHPHQ